MLQSIETINKLTVKARMAETAMGLSIVAGMLGLWPAWALLPIYGAFAANYEYKKYHLKNITSSNFESKPITQRLLRPDKT